MAKKFLTPVDLNQNQILNAVVHLLAADPSTPSQGQIWLNTTSGDLKIRIGGQNVVLATIDDIAGAGGGDMLAATYDTNGDGKVDAADAADAVPWSGVTGKPTEFTPAAHTHLAAEVTDLTTTVNGLIAAFIDDGAATNDQLDTITEIIARIQANADELAQLPKRHDALIGDGTETSIVVTHGLNTRNLIVQVYDSTTFEEVLVDVTRSTVNQVRLDFAAAPAANEYRVVILG